MNNRPTPETDAAIVAAGVEWLYYLGKCSRKLERERDEARADLEFRRDLYAHLCEAYILKEEYLETARRERDEAREHIERQRLEIVRLNGATNHAGGTPLKIALKERDGAREALENEKKWHHRTHKELIEAQCKLLDMDLKREEALDEIKRLKVILDLIKKDTI